jgi:DNA-binding MarR family transcriptional regulator
MIEPADLIHLITRAERLLARRVAEVLRAHGQTVEAWRVVSLLADGAGHPMTEVADRAFLPPATLTKLVDHLVDVNLVYRRVDDLDRRRIRAYLTPRGITLHQRISADIRESLAALSTSDGDRRALVRELTRLADVLAVDPTGRTRVTAPNGCDP